MPGNNQSGTLVQNSNSNSNLVVDIIQIILFAFIIIITSTYIVLVLGRRALRSAKFTLLTANICFSSALFAIIQILSIGVRLNNVSETVISCRVKGFLVNMATCHIMYSHGIASLCRLLSIKYPHKLLFKSTRWLLTCIGISWIVGLLITLPYIFFDSFTCTDDYGRRFLQIYTPITTLFIPIITVAVCNIIIFRYVRQSSKRVHNVGENTNNPLFSKRDINLCKIMLLSFCIFVIGWAPLFFEQIFFSNTGLSTGVTIFFQILPVTSLLADVILLVYSDQPVRKLIINAFKCNRVGTI